jgi:hypothetical protein
VPGAQCAANQGNRISHSIADRPLVAADPTASSSRIIRSGDIALTEPAWLIEGILPRTGLTLLVGKEASYKSFAALSMAGSILAGLS